MTDSASRLIGKGGRYAAALARCREPVLDYCERRLTTLLDRAGSALVDFAERAESNQVQGRFFEAVLDLRQQRDGILHRFLANVARGFDEFADPPQAFSADPAESTPLLPLVATDETYEAVVCEKLIIKANGNCFPELYALSQRLAVINGGSKIQDYLIAGGPHQLVHALRDTLRVLDMDIKVKIIFYALFDIIVMHDMESVHRQMNQRLKDAGILPHIKPAKVKNARECETRERPKQHPGVGSADRDGAVQQTGSLDNELFERVVELMSRRRGEAAAMLAPRTRVASGFVEPPCRRPGERALNTAGGGDKQSDERFVGRIEAALKAEREEVLIALDGDKLPQADADVINLIGLLFEYMLNDPVLPGPAKALISQLHTSYLKLALIDRTMLVNSDHVARRLLDRMVEAGSLEIAETRPDRGIYPQMQRVVERVRRELSDDASLFDELLEYVDSAVAEQRKRQSPLDS